MEMPSSQLVDPFGRPVTYLRVSVTDRCNLRCVYCMPPEGVEWQPHDSILRYEEIAAVVRVAAEHGVRQVRLTGGEPLVRKGLPDLVAMIAQIPGISDIALTTNGYLLESAAADLARAGLTRVNVSLDTLNPQRFSRITRGGSFGKVWQGLATVVALGLKPVKLNVVAMRGVNDDELLDLARLTLTRDWEVRFIEMMPVMNQAPWGADFPPPGEVYLSVQEMLAVLSPLGLRPTGGKVGCGPAQEFKLDGGLGKIGFITPVGQRFCEQCNRLRLTADGHLRPCLLNTAEVDLRPALRSGQPLLPLFQQALALKPQGHELENLIHPTGRCMMQIGG
jgi:cyclic pyranopterin phosphate synthase